MQNFKKNTSVSVKYEIFEILKEFCNSYEVSRSKIIRKLLKKGLKKIDSIAVDSILVEYQERTGIKCRIMHYSVDPYLCKNLSKVRDRYRISISKILCASFFLFWESIVEEITGENISDKFNSYEKILKNSIPLIIYFGERLGFEVKTILKKIKLE